VGDANSNGLPDLFVVNDFGSSQLYRNNGNGTFSVVSHEAQVEGVGAGMSCAWCDFDNDGHQDVYVPSMWRQPAKEFPDKSSSTRRLRRISANSISGTHAAMRFIATRETERFKTSGGKLAWKWAAGPGRRISGTLITTVTPTYMSPMGIFPDWIATTWPAFSGAGGSQIL